MDSVQLGIPGDLIFHYPDDICIIKDVDKECPPHGNEVLYEAAERHMLMDSVFIEWARQVGKTEGLGMLGTEILTLPHLLRTRQPEPLSQASIGFYAPIEDKAKKILDSVRKYMGNSSARRLLPTGKGTLYKDNQLHVHLMNDCEANAYNSSAKSVRGGAHNIGIVDESASIPREFYETCIEATGYELGERLIYSGTPSSVLGRHYELKVMARNNSCRVCQKCGTEWDDGAYARRHKWDYDPDTDKVFRIGQLEVNCPKCGAIHDDEHFTFTRVLPILLNPWLRITRTPRWIWDRLQLWGNDALIRQELLCEELPLGALMFPEPVLLGLWPEFGCLCPYLRTGNIAEVGRKIIGIDLGKHRDHTAVLILHMERSTPVGDAFVIDYAKRWPLKIDYHDVREEFVKIIHEYNVTEVVMDSLNPGESVCDELRHDLRGTKVKMFREEGKWGFRGTPRKKREILQNLQLRVMNRQLRVPDRFDPEISQLLHEMKCFSYAKIENSDNIRFGVQTDPDDMVLALAMALRGFSTGVYVPAHPVVVPRAQEAIHATQKSRGRDERSGLYKRPYLSRNRYSRP